MLQFKNVTKIYDKQIVAVNEVSFNIAEGEFVFLIGPSGSGKSTLIKMLVRDEKPSFGNIYFDDIDITRIGRGKVYKLRRQIGVIFQDFKLIQDKTAYENIAFAMEVSGKKNSEIKETVPYVLEIVGLNHRMSAFPRQLSGGEQQRVAIARALANNPKLLIADEPTGNLDPGSAWDIIQILSKINQWGTTVIMSTHGTDIVNTLDKRVIQMDKGLLVRDDAKGKYEMARKFESEVLKELELPLETKNSKIKLTFKNDKFINDSVKSKTEENNEMKNLQRDEDKNSSESIEYDSKPKHKKRFSNFRNLFKKVKVTNSLELPEQLPESPILHHENSKEKVKTNENKPLSKTNSFRDLSPEEKEPSEKSKTLTNIKVLNLGSKINKLLKKSKFKTIEQIIDAGPEGLESNTELTKEQIIKIAKKITEYTDGNV